MGRQRDNTLEDGFGLDILKEVSQIANSTLDLTETLQRIIEVIKNKMPIDACALFLIDEDKEHIKLMASSGFPEDSIYKVRLKLGEGISGWVARHKKTLALSDALKDPRFVHFPETKEERYHSILSVPMIYKGHCIGVINVLTRVVRNFSKKEISLLETISNQVSGCIHNAMVHQNSLKQIKELSILYDISNAIKGTLKPEQGLWVILSGITMGEAGGFNRAILFSIDEEKNLLQGIMGLGPDSPEDAHRIWRELGKESPGLIKKIISEVGVYEAQDSSFNQFAKTLQFPITPVDNILADTVLHKEPVNIQDAENDPRLVKQFRDLLGVNAFAIAPLVAQEKVLGAILVDNRYNQKPITETDIKLLVRFAAHASWVMEHSRLFSQLIKTNHELLTTREQLIQSEKLSALGELSTEVAHEIKNPLVSIGGFARRLKEKIADDSDNEPPSKEIKIIHKYAEIIVGEVERLEKILKDILFFSKTGDLELQECSINDLLLEIIDLFSSGFYRENIKIEYYMDPEIKPMLVDSQKIKQVLINLFYNSIDSMTQGGTLKINTWLQELVKGKEVVTISIEDSGRGIPSEILANIFNPFFTTKEAGTGLGLSICQRIVGKHGGTLRLKNQLGKGVTVYLQLPLQKIRKYNIN